MKMFEQGQSSVNEHQKSQAVRLVDVFLLAPFLLYVGYKAKGLKDYEKYGIYLIAISTLWYNGRNYLKNKNDRELKK